MKTTILFLLMIVSISAYAQQPIPCSTCPKQNVTVDVNVDMSTLEGQMDYGNGLTYQQLQLQEYNNRQNEAMLAELKEANRLQRKANTTATVNMVFNGVSAASNVWGNFQTRNTNLLLKDISRRTNQRPVKYINTTTNSTTNNYYTGGGNGGNTGGPGHNQNGEGQGRGVRSFL